MSYNNTQLTTASSFDVNQLIFSQPQPGTIPNSVPPIAYKRVNISIRNPDGTVGDLVLQTEQLFSFGVSANRDPTTQQINGYVMPLCLWNRDGATAAEKKWTDMFNAIVESCKQHLIDEKEEIEKYDLDESDLKKFNPLYWKREKGKIVSGTGPTLYCKLIVSKKDGNERIISVFYDGDTGDQVDPMQLMGKYCYVNAAVKVESIFIGNKCSLQIKLWEAQVSVVESGMKRLLQPSATFKPLAKQDVPLAIEEEKQEIQSVGSIEDSDEEDYASPKSVPVKKKVVRSRK